MVSGGESVKPAGACPVTNDAAACGDAVLEPRRDILEGPQGRVVVDDVDGDGVYDPSVDELYALADGEVENIEAENQGAGPSEIAKRLKAMGIAGAPDRCVSVAQLKEYVDRIREARAVARAGDSKKVEHILMGARSAAEKAGIPVELAVEGEVRSAAEYYGLISMGSLSSLPYFDKAMRKDVEGNLEAAEEIAAEAGIDPGQVEKDAQNARYLVSQTRLVEGISLAREGKRDEALRALHEGIDVADMGGFEEQFTELLKVEYVQLISADSLSHLPFFDEKDRNDVEGFLDAAAVVGRAAGIPADKIEGDAQAVRFDLCVRNYVDATMLAKEGKVSEARALLEKANSISDIGDYDSVFEITQKNIEKVLAEIESSRKAAEVKETKEPAGLDAILTRIQETLTRMPHPSVKMMRADLK